MSPDHFRPEIKIGWTVTSLSTRREFERAAADVSKLRATDDSSKIFELIEALSHMNDRAELYEEDEVYLLVLADHDVPRGDLGPIVSHFDECEALQEHADDLARLLGWTLGPLSVHRVVVQ